jgi:hypothetical protein
VHQSHRQGAPERGRQRVHPSQEPELQRRGGRSIPCRRILPSCYHSLPLPVLVRSQRVLRWLGRVRFQTFREPELVLQRRKAPEQGLQILQSHPGRVPLQNHPGLALVSSRKDHPELAPVRLQTCHQLPVQVPQKDCWRVPQSPPEQELQIPRVPGLPQTPERGQRQSPPEPGQHQNHHRQILPQLVLVLRTYYLQNLRELVLVRMAQVLVHRMLV